MEVALVKHTGDGKVFAFEVPSLAFIHKGDKVLCDTKYGEQEGEVVAEPKNIYSDDDKEFLAMATCCTFPLNKITAKIEIRRYEEPKADAPIENNEDVIRKVFEGVYENDDNEDA